MARTQDALYAEIDLELSWSERELPERERTKHVHRLHPYLGKFVPQLVEALLDRYVPKGGNVLDPFAGSGTTLVQSLESGYDATGLDVAAFNCLLMRVKTGRYNEFVLESEIRDALARLATAEDRFRGGGYVGQWFAPQAGAELLAFRSLIDYYEHADVLRVVLARAARSARLTAHFDLDRFRAIELYGYAAAYSPDPQRPGKALLPVDLATGRLIDDVWAQWLEKDPVRMAPAHADALRSLRRVYLDAGRSDEYYLDLGATAFGAELDKLGVEHTVELFDGKHGGIAWRYPGALRELVLALQ